MYQIFGLGDNGNDNSSSKGGDKGSSVDVLAVLKEVSGFRDVIRSLALEEKSDKKSLLEACDGLRKALQPHGVVFEDRTTGSSLVKLLDPEQLAREMQAAAEREAEALARKLALLKLQEEKAAAKAKKASVAPGDLFRSDARYSKWDERGIPTHDANGEELSKNARKKCLKEYEAQEALYNKSNIQ